MTTMRENDMLDSPFKNIDASALVADLAAVSAATAVAGSDA